MNTLFYISAAVAIISTVLVITRAHAVHALLYLIVSLLSVAMIFYGFGAPLVAALEVIVYAGAILVLFVFAMMLLNVDASRQQESQWLHPRGWIGPSALAFVLVAELVYVLVSQGPDVTGAGNVTPTQIGVALFGPYLLGVELASFLLLAGLVGAYHLGRPEPADKLRGGHHDVHRAD